MEQRTPETRAFDLVIFDLDNTLADHRGSLNMRLDHAFQERWPDEEERAAIVAASIESATDGTEHFATLFNARGVQDANEIERAIQRYESDRYRGLVLFDDSLSGIEQAARTFEVAMITNGPTDIQQPKLDLLGIEDLFSFVLISGSVGYWKPDPRIFELALQRAGVPAHRAVYIGDSTDHDIPGAHAAGLAAIWMNRWYETWPGGEPPDFIAHNMAEALGWLGA